ncbi:MULTISPECIES: DUF397 domain-containing protein [Streptomyces]|uniref:DUF397 domain-containing protein n=1 Tax=Streptomyces TaxID=1883 RepID=UPI0002830DD0|nr:MULTISPECIES: DUF397 domain-containing protein [unclassified Streptomyces]MCU4749065.1 DUF397 domain-containing protein [Streptomyces sp. G-5]PKA37636.1 DUF397 domain-containing protein [Streptomyces sp. SM8]QQN80492.1 DUF397 domain-containing protein [Streptomyces sp. XC 2026]
MSSEQPTQLHWFKSTYSSGEGGECVEVAANGTAVRIRDSKERGGPQLAFTRDAWAGFVADLGRDWF